MKKHDYNKLLTKAVVILLIFFFIGGMIWGASSVLEMEGVYELYEPAEGKSVRPVTAAEISAYLDAALAGAENSVSAVSSGEKFRLDEDTFSVTPESDILINGMKTIHEDFEEIVEDSFSQPETSFGDEYNGILSTLGITAQDIQSAECVCEYYQCSICGNTEDEIVETCEECQSTGTYEERISDEYKITIVLTDTSTSALPYFNIRTMQEIEKITSDAENCLSHTAPEIAYTKLSVYAVVNRMTDRLTHIEFNKEADAKTDVTFLGDYAPLGTRRAEFSYTDSMRYDITYPGIDIDESSVVLEPKKTETLKAALTCDDPTQYTTKWESSDSSVASIDENGVVKASKKDGTAIITASYEFMGVTYTDTCEINVRTPVEKADISKRSLTLSIGDEFVLTASVSPRKASIQTVKWYTSDESVATVDANGRVTAIGEGTAKVFAVSDDGHYKATCNVEVKR